MSRFTSCILMAVLAMLCHAAGCGPKPEESGRQFSDPPVAPLSEPKAGERGMTNGETTGEQAGRPDGGAGRITQPRGGNWPFRPTMLRIHPLTHALRSEGKVSIIEARIEFFDRFEHTTKALGVVRFELHGQDGGAARRLASWEIDLSRVEENMRHYDDVTRTYLFRLGLDGSRQLPETGRLDVTVTMSNQKMSGSIDIALR